MLGWFFRIKKKISQYEIYAYRTSVLHHQILAQVSFKKILALHQKNDELLSERKNFFAQLVR